MSRTLVYQILHADALLTTAGSLGALGVLPTAIGAAESVDSPKSHPFLTMRWGTLSKGVGATHVQFVDIWAHNKDRDYLLIDTILERVKDLLENVEAAQAPEGWITRIEWQSGSSDLRDDGYDTVTRNSTFKVVGSTR